MYIQGKRRRQGGQPGETFTRLREEGQDPLDFVEGNAAACSLYRSGITPTLFIMDAVHHALYFHGWMIDNDGSESVSLCLFLMAFSSVNEEVLRCRLSPGVLTASGHLRMFYMLWLYSGFLTDYLLTNRVIHCNK